MGRLVEDELRLLRSLDQPSWDATDNISLLRNSNLELVRVRGQQQHVVAVPRLRASSPLDQQVRNECKYNFILE